MRLRRISGQGSRRIVVINGTTFVLTGFGSAIERKDPTAYIDGREKGKVPDGRIRRNSGWILVSRLFDRNSEGLAEKLGKSLALECKFLDNGKVIGM